MWEVIGFEKVNGVAKNTGEVYTAYRLHMEAVRPKSGFEGREVRVEFYKMNRIDYTPQLGDRVILESNQYGLTRIEVM